MSQGATHIHFARDLSVDVSLHPRWVFLLQCVEKVLEIRLTIWCAGEVKKPLSYPKRPSLVVSLRARGAGLAIGRMRGLCVLSSATSASATPSRTR